MRHRSATHQGNYKVARQMESAERAKRAEESRQKKEKGSELGCKPEEVVRCSECEKWFNSGKVIVGDEGEKCCTERCREEWNKRQKPILTVAEFIDQRFEPWARATFEKTSPQTWLDWYRVGLRAIKGYKPLANAKLSAITSEKTAEFAAYRQTQGLQVSTVNSSLRVLRRVLRLAVEWGALEATPLVKLLRGERHRDRVVAQEEEARYLAAAPELVGSIAAVLVDTGLRPEECFRLCWDAIAWVNGRHGTLFVTHGKTTAARRVLPITLRVRNVLEARWEAAGKPEEGWVWPAPTRSGHVESSSLKKQHARTFKTIAEQPAKSNVKPVRPFVLYSLRHTFLTRLGESGCDVWTLARIAGHSSITISSRYVHPSHDAVFDAMSRLGGHNIGHRAEQPPLLTSQ
jgi:integrase